MRNRLFILLTGLMVAFSLSACTGNTGAAVEEKTGSVEEAAAESTEEAEATATEAELNLALALQSCSAVSDVDFETIWGAGHTEAERTGNSTDNFIAWVNECMK